MSDAMERKFEQALMATLDDYSAIPHSHGRFNDEPDSCGWIDMHSDALAEALYVAGWKMPEVSDE